MPGRFLFRSHRQPGDAPERRLDVFVRGLLSGALVGAVIAGSTIWQRRQRGRVTPVPPPGAAKQGPEETGRGI
jgi:hypothetical protein